MSSNSPEISQKAAENLQAGRDIKIGDIIQTINQSKPDFFEPNPKLFESSDFLSPKPDWENALMNILRKNYLLVMGGSNEIDKATLARYLAWKFQKSLDGEASSHQGNTQIKEWNRSSDIQSLDVAFQKEEKTTIFVLTQIAPKDIGYDLSRIKEAITSYNHYVVVSTIAPKDKWKLPENVEKCWRNIEAEDIYDPKDLANLLKRKLEKVKQSLADENLQIFETLSPGQLKTPDRIDRFVELLGAEKEPLQEARVRDLIKITTDRDQKDNIQLWYYTLLKPREQLLALGLSLFSGCFDDQFFAALEEVTTHVWQRRDASLRAPDYCDLDNLRNFFNFVETEESGTKIESRISDQRRLIFEVAWNSHRRQILAALPQLEKLVKESASKRTINQELYGSSERRKQLRDSIGDAISDIGLIDFSAVEGTLYQLAADREIEVQAIAAYTMARWLSDPQYQQEKLFQILQSWQSDARIISVLRSILQKLDESNTEEPQDYVRATIALTIGYAAQFYPPQDPSDSDSGLPSQLCDRLKNLADDPNSLVRDRLASDTLPRVVPLHLIQLRPLLCYMMRYRDLIPSISASLAVAYSIKPKAVKKTLETWSNNQPDRFSDGEPPREHLLATVALTYGAIEGEPLKAFERLQTLLIQNNHPFVRQAVIEAMGVQLSRNFNDLENNDDRDALFEVTTKLTRDERKQVVAILTEIYLVQRERLEGGDRVIKIKDRFYPIWLHSHQRPRTAVEQTMNRWIKKEPNDTNALAQEIATEALFKFASVFELEEERIKLQEDTDGQSFVTKPTVGEIISRRPEYGLYLDKLVPWIVTRQNERYRPYVRNLLPEALKLHKIRNQAMDFVLEKWKKAKDEERRNDEQIRKISDFLEEGFFWAKYLNWLIASSGVLLIALGIVAIDLVRNRPIPLPPPEPPISDSIIPIAPFGIVEDEQSPNFDRGSLTVKFSANGTPSDRLGIKESGEVGIEETDVTYQGVAIGRFLGGEGVEPLVVNFNDGATREAVEALIRQITYDNVSDNPTPGERKVEFQLTDGDGGTSNTLSTIIHVIASETALDLKVPGEQTVKENTNLPISGISIDAPDNQKATAILEVNNGTLTLKSDVANGLTADNISNNETQQVTLTGTVAQINATLADTTAIAYKGDREFSGLDSLTVTVTEEGKNVENGLVWPPNAQIRKTLSQNISIAVETANPPPIITLPPAKLTNEDTDLTLDGIQISDPNSKDLTVNLAVNNGTLTIKTDVAEGLTAENIQKNETQKVTLQGSIEQINKTLASSNGIIYRGNPNFSGNDLLYITANDTQKFTRNTLSITVNDRPTLSIPESVTTESGIRIEKVEALALINQYLQAKERIFAFPYDRELAARILTGKAFAEKVSQPGGGSLEWLRENRAYWIYGEQNVEPIGSLSVTGDEVNLDVRISEELAYYENGIREDSDTNVGDYKFTLQMDDNVWKISNIQSK
ncbi:MAG: IMS domain-containing protein [Oscillatoria sp. PMC 1051.18]|nr:IMS domain-containing protein [Oscillatoria sp. PMC 1050.18]MEC5030487.1 IMS domain-containing protein [Oscillatoria sp. PMC 1051.18]